MTDAPFDLETVDRLLSTTRAVRRRLDLERPVERSVLVDCLRLSQQAPTGSNAQGWRWLVVTDAAKRAALADLYRKAGEGYLAVARSQTQGDDPQTSRVYDSAMWLLEHLAEVPVHVIPCLLGRLPDTVPEGMRAGFYGSIFPAVWSFQLALRSRGLGSVLTTLHLGAEREAAELLGVPFDQVTQVALLPVAYTKGTEFRPARRRPVEEICYWDAWKDTRG
jgi:nitroreductase